MASITIRNLDEQLKARLRLAAAGHGHSMEEEVRVILRDRLMPAEQRGLGSRIRQRFQDAEQTMPEPAERVDIARPADFER